MFGSHIDRAIIEPAAWRTEVRVARPAEVRMVLVIALYAIGGALLACTLGMIAAMISALARRGELTAPAKWGLRAARGWVRRSEGPVEPGMALLTPAARVCVELCAAACGFPGLGWMLSGRVFAGLVMISLVPAIVWGFCPAYLCVSRPGAGDPLTMLAYLPAIGVVSALFLALVQRQCRARPER